MARNQTNVHVKTGLYWKTAGTICIFFVEASSLVPPRNCRKTRRLFIVNEVTSQLMRSRIAYPPMTRIAPPSFRFAQATKEGMTIIWFCFDTSRSDRILNPFTCTCWQRGLPENCMWTDDSPLQWKSSSPTAIAIRMRSISAHYWQFCNFSDGSRELHQDRPMRTKGTHPTWICKTRFPFKHPNHSGSLQMYISRFTINDPVLSETSQTDSLPIRGPAATALYGKSRFIH